MGSKNLTKSFGVRVPLDLYMQMLKVSTENKLTITDLCLYSIMHSGILNGELNFKKGGEVDDEKYTTEIRRLNGELTRMQRAFSDLREANTKLKDENDEKLTKWILMYNECKEKNQELKNSIEHWKDMAGQPKRNNNK